MEAAALESPPVQDAEQIHGCGVAFRPCPFAACRYSLLDTARTNTGTHPDPARGVDRSDTCALDVAERGPSTLREVARRLDLTQERVRQIEQRALVKLRIVVDEMRATGEI